MNKKLEQKVIKRKEQGKILLDNLLCPIVINIYKKISYEVADPKNDCYFHGFDEWEPSSILYGGEYYPTNALETGWSDRKFKFEIKQGNTTFNYSYEFYRDYNVFHNKKHVFNCSVSLDQDGIKKYIPGNWEKDLQTMLESSLEKYNKTKRNWERKHKSWIKKSVRTEKERIAKIHREIENESRKNFGI